MEIHNFHEGRLIAPNDFTSPAISRDNQTDLVPPSHFAVSAQFAGTDRGAEIPTTTQHTSWVNSGVTSASLGDPSPPNPWLALSQAQQEIFELRKENQRLTVLQKARIKGSDRRARCEEEREQWSTWESERHKAEAERLKRQVEALKDTAETRKDEIRARDSVVNRLNHELEAMHEELCQAKSDLSQTREELVHNSAHREKISSQLERLRKESAEEIAKLRRDAEKCKEEVQEYTLKTEMCRLQTEEEAKHQALRLSEQLGEMHKKQEVEMQLLNASHHAELDSARKTNGELQDRLQSMTSEMLQLKSSLMEITTERDGIKENLSQMGQAFETQSATLHSLRNYIGQLAPEKGEERLNDTVERLNKEKAALQMTAELLTVRLNSVNEILILQEEKMVKKTSTDPLGNNESGGLQVLHLWREKVFKLCVQLRLKDIELREEKNKFLSEVRSMEQHLQKEQHRACVLQHSLDDRIAELDLERVEKETLKQGLVQAQRENSQLKSQKQKSENELQTLREAVHRFSLAFDNRMAEVDAAQTRLNTLTQRLTFAKGRVETIQGLIMRKVALRKIQQASKQTEQITDSITSLQTEISLVRDERDKLTQELKRTPELIDKSLANLKEQYESKLRRYQQELEQSWVEVRQAEAGREAAEQSLQQIQAQLEESKIKLEELSSELLSQQKHSECALQERVSEIEGCCAEKLREMEVQVNTAKREHTKAVMILRHFEREAARKRDEMREHLENEHAKSEVQDKQLKDMEKDKNPLLASAGVGGLLSVHTRAHTATYSAAPQQKNSQRSPHEGAEVQHAAQGRLLSVLEELRSLSVAVVNSSEDSAEEEEEDKMTAQSCSQAVHT